MAELNDRNNPSFLLLPINNNRTAWRPISMPVVMVVPRRRDPDGAAVENSSPFNVRVYIEDVPREALVAGHDNIGKRYPDSELYAESLTSLDLADRFIDLDDHTFVDSSGSTIDKSEAEEGDSFEFTTSTGVSDTIPYLPDADYYDLSDVEIEMELLPADRYNLVYESHYFYRVVSQNELQEFLCVNSELTAVAAKRIKINHPGEVLNEFYNLTPPPYLTNSKRSLDTTIGLYRPFTDALQDIYDEQDILESVNWVHDVPAEAIPYLSSLLGWELPYFPRSLDRLRRAVLRRTVEFQNLSGSRRAIINLFRLFGFEILLSNLWWSSDGKRYIRPGERLPDPYQDEEITIEDICQVDLLLDDPGDNGFATYNIPLLFRPQVQSGFGDFGAVRDSGDITLESYVVEKDSSAYDELSKLSQDIRDNPDNFDPEGCSVDGNGFISSDSVSDRLDGLETIGFSQVLISGSLGLPHDSVIVGDAVISEEGVHLDRESNNIRISINKYLDSNTAIFCFAIYKRQKIVVPDIIKDLQSNRFDIQVLTQNLDEFADPVTLEFAIEFLNRLKAFHSILNVIRTRIDLTETYQVTDFCVGGDNKMRYDIAAGKQQVPPAIIPDVPDIIDDCSLLDPNNLGYKESDIVYRLRVLSNLSEEFEAWKALDDIDYVTNDSTMIGPNSPDGEECKYTKYGQDRVTVEDNVIDTDQRYHPTPLSSKQAAGQLDELSPNDIVANGLFDGTGPLISSNSDTSPYGSFIREFTAAITRFCSLDGSTDYCYKGRVADELLHRQTITNSEFVQHNPCSVGLGKGMYYTYPANSVISTPGTANPCNGSKTNKIRFSGKATSGNEKQFLNGSQSAYLEQSYDEPLSLINNSHIGRLYRSYGVPKEQTLHFTNRQGMPEPDQRYNLALDKPSLNIEKPTLHLPGCRFPVMNKLESDFVHDEWDARPWDYDLCGPKNICDQDNNPLNAEIEIGSDGNEYLSFDIVPYSIDGNGLVPDVMSLTGKLDTGNDLTPDDIVHSVYTTADDSRYVDLDQVEISGSTGDVILVDDPLFSSYNVCGTGDITDIIDGYPSSYGYFQTNSTNYDEWGAVLEALGMETTHSSIDVSFTLGSGIRSSSVSAHRLDCGCLLTECDTGGLLIGYDGGYAPVYYGEYAAEYFGSDIGSGTGGTLCSLSQYLDSDGEYDWSMDRPVIIPRLLSEEEMDTRTVLLDGSVPSLLEVS